MRRSIVVTGKTELRSGTSASGRDWTLWLLTARDGGSGQEIGDKLKSFDEPQLGIPVEAEMEPDDREEGCYMLRFGGGSSRPSLGDRVERLESQVEWLTQSLLDATGARPRAVTDGQAELAPEPDDGAAADEADEDIPF